MQFMRAGMENPGAKFHFANTFIISCYEGLLSKEGGCERGKEKRVKGSTDTRRNSRDPQSTTERQGAHEG